MKNFPFFNWYVAGPDFLSDFENMSPEQREKIRKQLAATQELRERFSKRVSELAAKPKA